MRLKNSGFRHDSRGKRRCCDGTSGSFHNGQTLCQIVLKHSAKFGLNPGDRKKIFKVIDQKRRKKTFDTDHTNYNALFIEWWNAQEERGEVNMDYLEAFREYYRQHNQEPATDWI